MLLAHTIHQQGGPGVEYIILVRGKINTQVTLHYIALHYIHAMLCDLMLRGALQCDVNQVDMQQCKAAMRSNVIEPWTVMDARLEWRRCDLMS